MNLAFRTELRWPSELRQAVVEAARDSGRSMNSEIIHRLKSTFRPDPLAQSHGDLMPCPCGAGRPDAIRIMLLNGGEDHRIACPCGWQVADESEGGAALKWNALVRGKAGRAAR